MSFLRPEAAATLNRWRETLAGLGAALVGLYLLINGYGAGVLVGAVLVVAGLGLAVAGVQRARFRGAGDGPGVVQVNEGRIVYFGPVTGGTVAVAEMRQLDYDGVRDLWLLWEAEPEPLEIPTEAAGADELFDAFAALPGLETGKLLAAKTSGRGARTVVWTRSAHGAPLTWPEIPSN